MSQARALRRYSGKNNNSLPTKKPLSLKSIVLYHGAVVFTCGGPVTNVHHRHHIHLPVSMGYAPSSEQEFERLYLDSYGMVYGYVRARMRTDAEAEDVVAEAFLKAARAFDSFDPGRAKFGTWVTTIAKNCMASYYRKERPSVELDDVPESLVAIEGDQDHVDNDLLVRQLLTCLNDEEREIVALKYRDGLRNVDIAESLSMNASTVSTKLATALAKMRAMLQKDESDRTVL